MKNLLLIDGFDIFGINIKFYGILIALAMLCGVIVATFNAKFRDLKKDDIFTLALYCLPLAVLGARIHFVISEVISGYSYTFLEFLDIRQGGMAIYGGVIGGAFAVMLFCLIHKKNFLNVADVAVVSLILGQSIGRWGNFFNQELYGFAVTDPNFQWFPFAVYIDSLHASMEGWYLALFFYEFILNLAIFFTLHFLLRKVRIKGLISALYLILYGIVRLFLEGLRQPQFIMYYWGTIPVNQILSGILIFVGIILAIIFTLLPRWKKKKEQKEKLP